MHSPDIPESIFRADPSGGAISPLRARQTIAPLLRKASAVPPAAVKTQAASAIARKIASAERFSSASASRKTVKKSAALAWVRSPAFFKRSEL